MLNSYLWVKNVTLTQFYVFKVPEVPKKPVPEEKVPVPEEKVPVPVPKKVEAPPAKGT